MDFLPPYGFMQRPSMAWPPPNADELNIILEKFEKRSESARAQPSATRAMPQTTGELETAIQGFSVEPGATPDANRQNRRDSRINLPTTGPPLTTHVHGKVVEIKDQVQMYTTNQLLSHPLVSPIFQPTLGGLPPLLILTGGGEILRDEQIYIAHKAANPNSYPPSEENLDQYDPTREVISTYPPTYVQLQVWDDLCHIAATLSFTRPAKHMFRSIAQFSAWALSRAQGVDIEIPENHNADAELQNERPDRYDKNGKSPTKPGIHCVGQAGDPLPRFHNHMVRQRVDRNGRIYPLADESSFAALRIPPERVGAVNPDPLHKWMAAKRFWDSLYAREKLQVQEKRIEELLTSIEQFGEDEFPPPSSLAARKGTRSRVPKERRRNRGMTLWSRWASKADIKAMSREGSRRLAPETTTVTAASHSGTRADGSHMQTEERIQKRPLNRTRTVTDRGQANGSQDAVDLNESDTHLNLPTTPTVTSDEHIYPSSFQGDDNVPGPSDSQRSEYRLSGGIMPEINRKELLPNANNEEASTVTIMDAEGVIPPSSGASSSRLDWKTPDEYNLSPQDTPSVYSQDTQGNSGFRKASVPITKSGLGENASGIFKKTASDFESVNLEPSDTEPFPAFPSSSGDPSLASRA